MTQASGALARRDAEERYGGTLDFNGNGIAGCVRCGWRGIAPGGSAGRRCPVCSIAPEVDAEYRALPKRRKAGTPTLPSKGVAPGRNRPCTCGSGKKSKKCCYA